MAGWLLVAQPLAVNQWVMVPFPTVVAANKKTALPAEELLRPVGYCGLLASLLHDSLPYQPGWDRLGSAAFRYRIDDRGVS